MRHVIVNITKTKEDRIFVICHYDERNLDVARCERISEKQLVPLMRTGLALDNALLTKEGIIKGSPASLSRFNTHPMVVLSRIVSEGNRTVGFRVVSPLGKVAKYRLADVMRYCDTCKSRHIIPFQNAIYVEAAEGVEAHIKSYPEKPFINEVISTKVNNNAVIRDKVQEKVVMDSAQLEKISSDTASLYTREQLEQLQLGIKAGINVSYYADPKIDWRKMKIIRVAMQRGLDVRYITHPDYIIPCKIDSLMYVVVVLAEDVDIRNLLNPEYSVDQLSELHAGLISFVDINKYSDPSISASKMAEIRVELEKKLWGDEFDV